MQQTIVSVVIVFAAFLSDFVLAWYGVVTFYQDTEFGGTDFPWGITQTQRCYNLGCFNDKASSVKWEGLPTTGVFNGQARIAFFTGKECTGDSRDWPTDGVINEKEGNYPMNFKLDGINDAVSSFMIWENMVLPASATDLWLYDHDDYDKHKTFKRFNFGTSQRCYSIGNCFDDKASSATWINAPSAAWFAFYDKADCTGSQYVSKSTPSGQIKFASVNLDNKVSSFMLWEYGTFALKGFVDICEAATLRSANASASSTSVDSGSSSSNGSVSFY